MKRKTPVRHIVRTHKRQGRTINHYIRGKGSKKLKIANPVPWHKKITKMNWKDRVKHYVENEFNGKYTVLDRNKMLVIAESDENIPIEVWDGHDAGEIARIIVENPQPYILGKAIMEKAK